MISFRRSIQLTDTTVAISLLFKIVSIFDSIVLVSNNNASIRHPRIHVAENADKIAQPVQTLQQWLADSFRGFRDNKGHADQNDQDRKEGPPTLLICALSIPVWTQRNGESLPGVISVDYEEVSLPIKKSISHHSTLAHFRLALEIIVVKVCNKQR